MDDQQVTSRYALAMTLAAALLGWMFDGFEMGLFPLVARPALMELMGPEASKTIGTWFSVIIAMFLVGAACGGLFFGWLGDRIGRVRALVWSVATYSVFSGLCGFATAPWHLAVLRFIASLGMGGEWALGVALVMEVWPSSSRPMLAGLIGVASNAGFLLIALMGLGLVKMIGSIDSFFTIIGMPAEWKNALLSNSAWRLLLFLGAMPAILTFFILLFVPESPRWKQAAAQFTKKPRFRYFQRRTGKINNKRFDSGGDYTFGNVGFDAVAAGLGGQVKRTAPDSQIMGTNLVGRRARLSGLFLRHIWRSGQAEDWHISSCVFWPRALALIFSERLLNMAMRFCSGCLLSEG